MRWLRQWGPVAIWAMVILVSSDDRLSSDHTLGLLQRLFGNVPEWINLAMRKTGHVLAYGVLGVLAFRASRTLRAAMLVTFAVSAIDEWHQSFFASRTGTPWDVVLDCCGAFVAVMVYRSAAAKPPL